MANTRWRPLGVDMVQPDGDDLRKVVGVRKVEVLSRPLLAYARDRIPGEPEREAGLCIQVDEDLASIWISRQ